MTAFTPKRTVEVHRDGTRPLAGADVERITYDVFWNRVAQWAVMRTANIVRDDGARLFACADVLAVRSALSARSSEQLSAVCDELDHNRIAAHELLALLPSDSIGRDDELRRILSDAHAVSQLLDTAGRVHRSAALRLAVKLIEAGSVPSSVRGRVWQVRDPIDLTDLEIDVFIAVARAGIQVDVYLPLDGLDRGIFAGAEAVLRRFEQAHDVDTLDIRFVDWAANNKGPVTLCDVLFDPVARAHDAPAIAACHVVSCLDKNDEAARVAAIVAGWRRANPDARIAVCVRTVDDDTPRYVDALSAVGLATRVGRRSLAHTPAGRLALDVLTLSNDGAPRDRLLAYLSSALRPQALDVDTASSVWRVLRRAGAASDIEDSTMQRGGYAHRLGRYHNGLDARDAERTHVVRALTAVQAALDGLAQLPRLAPLGEHLEALAKFLSQQLEDGAGFYVRETLDALIAAAATCQQVRGRSVPIDARAACRVVSATLQHATSTPAPSSEVAVEMLSAPDLWGRLFDHVVLCGVEEGRFPAPQHQRGLLVDADRARLSQLAGRAFRGRHTQLRADRTLSLGLESAWLFGVVKAAEVSFVCTRAERDDRGRQLAPSAFFSEIERVSRRDASAGTMSSPRQLRVLSAQRRANGLLDDGAAVTAGLSPATTSRVDLLVQMRADRTRFFSRSPTSDPALVRGSYAFAVDPGRIARVFGDAFGLAPKRPLTPTRLEALAECRMRGFVQHVMKVDVDPPAGNVADARIIGILAHTVLERFFVQRKQTQVPLSIVTSEDRTQLNDYVDEEMAPLLAGKATGHLRAIRAQIAWLKVALIRAVSTLARDPKVRGVEPVDFEVHIGTPARDGVSTHLGPVPMLLGDTQIFVGGVIDRVDEGVGGRVVIDYKTASTSSIRRKAHKDALFVKHFQLLLYLRLLEHHRPTAPHTPMHGYLVSVKDGTTSDDVCDVEDLRARITDDTRADGLAHKIAEVVLPILQGTIPPDASSRCESCRLQRVCRVPLQAEFAADLDDSDDGAAP